MPCSVTLPPDEIDDVGALGLQSIVQQVKWIFRPSEICRDIREEQLHVPSLAVLESRVMLEVRFQHTGRMRIRRALFSFRNFFRFVEQAEEEMFRAAGEIRQNASREVSGLVAAREAFSSFPGLSAAAPPFESA